MTISFNTTVFANNYKPNEHLANINKKLAKLEKTFNGKIGVYAIDTTNDRIISYHSNDRFPVQSTMKIFIASALLKQSESNINQLQEKIYYTKNNLTEWHPITGNYINQGMTLESLAEAAVTYSDNPAANLILKKFGGPNFATKFAQSIGNPTFNVTHYEGNLNSNPNSNSDTSTPKDMAISVQKLLLGNSLNKIQQNKLISWMTNNTTGYKRIRAGIPNGFTVADKTGSGNYGVANDLGIIWSPLCKPIVLSIYTIQNEKNTKPRENIIAKTTKIILTEFANNNQCFVNTAR